MKFVCDRCGKRFSSVDDPLPGRVYRIRCRCGNSIEIAAPRVVPEELPHAKGGMPLRGGAPAPPAKIATPAGDGPVSSERIPTARAPAPRRPVTGSAAFEAPIPRVPAPPPASSHAASPAQPHASPGAAINGDPFAAVLEPGAPGGRTARTSTAIPAFAASAETSPAPQAALPWPSPFPEGLPPELELPRAEPPAPSADPGPTPDPFAAAAAHVTRVADPFEVATAPVAPSVLQGPPARAPAGAPVRPEPVPGAAGEDETSVELSSSAQYEVPYIRRHERRPRGGAGRLVVAVLVSAVIGVAGAAGAYLYLQRKEVAAAVRGPPPVATAAQPSTALAPSTPTATPTPTPTPSSPVTPTAREPPLAMPAPPAEKPRGPSAAERRAQKKEEERRSAERRAEAERLEAERKVEADRKAEAERRAAAERKAEADRKAEAERRAAAERKAEADRKAEAERRAAAESKVASATPAQDPAVQESARKKEAAAQKVAEPLQEGLTPDQMTAVIRANRASLETCVQAALSDKATASYAGRKVFLMILVGPNGKADAALEDSDLDGTAFGTCVRRATSRMPFPAFRGEAVGARIPIQMGRAE